MTPGMLRGFNAGCAMVMLCFGGTAILSVF
jgi:hypothetical protein